MKAPPLDTLEIVGTTTVHVTFPKRLSPVYRSKGGEGSCYFTVAEDAGAHPVLSPEAAAYFAQMVETGDAVTFADPIPAKSGHCLVRFEGTAAPEYLPFNELPMRLRRACREALEQASSALGCGRRDQAEDFAWVARRSDEDDPLPLLVLIALVRGAMPADELRYLEQDLEQYTRQQVDAARRRAKEAAELIALAELLDEPPKSGERPKYLADYPRDSTFLSRTRTFTAGRRSARG